MWYDQNAAASLSNLNSVTSLHHLWCNSHWDRTASRDPSLNENQHSSLPLTYLLNYFHKRVSLELLEKITGIGLGTAATTIPMGWGDRIAGLPLDILVTPLVAVPSVFFAGDSPGKGDCSFCSCCFFWILRCSCCLASTGDDRVFTCGWKELLSAVGIKAEGWGIPFIPEHRRRRMNYNNTYTVCCSATSVSNCRYIAGISTTIQGTPHLFVHARIYSVFQFLSVSVSKLLSVRQAGH